MQKEHCIEVLNELGGQCWPQHQLTQLLIMALIRAADGESPCNPEYKRPAETCSCTLLTAEIQKKALSERMCVHFKNRSFLIQLPSSFISNSHFLMLTSDLFEETLKRVENKSAPKNSPNTFYLVSLKQRVKGTCCPHPKNMKQQQENVYWSSLPTSQAEGKIGIFIMKRGR